MTRLALLLFVGACAHAAPAVRSPAKPGPVMIALPAGWTDLVTASRDEVEALAPGLYDHAYPMVGRNGYQVFAFDLRPDSPDSGSTMTLLPLGGEGTVDEPFLDGFVERNNLNLTRDATVDKQLLDVRGRPVAKWRTEYDAAQERVTTLVYLFPDDQGNIMELVFVVRADRYMSLREQIEAIEGRDPVQEGVLEQQGD